MTVDTRRPDAAVAPGDWTASAGTLHGATSDDTDSYIHDATSVAPFDPATIGFAEPSLPTDAVWKEFRLRAKLANPSAGTRGVKFTCEGETKTVIVTWASTTEVTVMVVPTGSISSAVTCVVEKTGEYGPNPRIYELFFDGVYVTKPSLTVTPPSGSVLSEDTTPQSSWTPSLDASGGPQAFYEVKIFDDATYGGGGFDPDVSTAAAGSGEVSGSATSWAPDDPLPDGTYKTYVRNAQLVNGVKHYSPWTASSAWTLAIDRPAAPALILAPDDAAGRIAIFTAERFGDAEAEEFQIQVSDDGEAPWENLRTVLGAGVIGYGEPGADALRANVLGLEPEIYLPLDATYGLDDQSGNGHDGTAQGGLGPGEADGPFGDPGGATAFDGSDDYVSTGFDAFANGTKRLWGGRAARDNQGAAHTLFGGTGANATRLVLVSGSQNATFHIGGSTYTFTAAWPNDSEFHDWMLAFNESADAAELWVDGLEIDTISGITQQHAAGQTLRIGAHGSGSDPFDGRQAHFFVGTFDSAAEAEAIAVNLSEALAGVGYDYEAPNGATRHYRARAIHHYTDNDALSEWTTDDATWSSADAWLKSPTNPSLNLAVVFDSAPSERRSARQGIFQALGAAKAIVLSDTRATWTGTVSLHTATAAEQDALVALLDLGEPLLLQGTPEDFWTDRYIAVGDLERSRAPDKGFVEAKIDSFDWTEVETPAGDVVAWP